jgi:hypothetical protein
MPEQEGGVIVPPALQQEAGEPGLGVRSLDPRPVQRAALLNRDDEVGRISGCWRRHNDIHRRESPLPIKNDVDSARGRPSTPLQSQERLHFSHATALAASPIALGLAASGAPPEPVRLAG